jgi:formiminotetrahydrofolate cyclodeaminase
MSYMREDTLQTFLSLLASKAPAPGGGAAAGLSGAMGAALTAMVANLTIGKKRYAAVEDEMRELADEADKCVHEMLALAEEDKQAFLTLMMAYKLSKETPEAAAKRSDAIQSATKVAALVPLHVAKVSVDIMRLAQKSVQKGNTQAVSDGASSCILARAALRVSAYNVRINMNSIKDTKFNSIVGGDLVKYEEQAAQLETEILKDADQVLDKN